MTPAAERELAALVARYQFLSKPLGEFIPTVSPRYVTPWHLRPLLDVMERVEDEPLRVLLSAPPRHGKSEALLHAMAWYIARNPTRRVCYVSYSVAFAAEQALKARMYAEAAGVSIAPDSRSKKRWRTTAGGSFVAVGIGGQLTGLGVDLLVVDDAVKDRAAAESPLQMGKLYEWWSGVARTRLEPGGSMIVLHTRWSLTDLIGRLLKEHGDGWTLINLPAIDDDGRALWPERYSVKELLDLRAEIGLHDFESLYQGRPRPRGSEVFKQPVFYERPEIEGRKIVIGVDPAATSRTTSDYSTAVVLAVGGYGAEMRADVLEIYRAQVEIPELVAELERLQTKWNGTLVVESVGAFKVVPQLLRKANPRLKIQDAPAIGDKWQRAQAVALACAEGRLRVPTSAPWLKAFLEELLAFTGMGDAHDDQIDGLAHGFNHAASTATRPLHLERGPFAQGQPKHTDEWGRPRRAA